MDEKIRIMVVDDKKENLDAARTYFSSTSYEVSFFDDVEKVKKAIHKSTIDDFFHFGFIDLEMEYEGVLQRAAGHHLSVFAFQNGVINMIVTHKNVYRENHGYYDFVIGSKFAGTDPFTAANGFKSDPSTWKELDKTFQYHYGRTIFAIEVAHKATVQNGKKPNWWESFIKDGYNNRFHKENYLLDDLIKEKNVPKYYP